jgi:ABC-2 type transport system ATP-binding protein
VAILHRGRCVAEGSVASVMASAGHAGLVVRVDDLAAGLDVLCRAGLAVERCDGHLRIALDPGLAGEVTRILAAERLWVTELRPEERTLEDLFLELTSDDVTSRPTRDDPTRDDTVETDEEVAAWAR